MKFEIESKNEDGSVLFSGTANQSEASFLLNIGINYLLSQGAMPLLTGKEEEGVGFAISEEPDTVQ